MGGMKITPYLLSIPPHLSVAWEQIAALVREGPALTIILLNKKEVQISGLSEEEVSAVFSAHALYSAKKEKTPFAFGNPFSLKLPPLGAPFADAALHNPEHANLPPLPPEILEKIGMVAQTLGLADGPPAEPNCNCFYCQVARTLNPEASEERVSDEELSFRTWDVHQKGDKLYAVTNPLDPNETYQVFLGSPVGCTCGDTHCEHIRAVLQS
jgi:hypothetical protein